MKLNKNILGGAAIMTAGCISIASTASGTVVVAEGRQAGYNYTFEDLNLGNVDGQGGFLDSGPWANCGGDGCWWNNGWTDFGGTPRPTNVVNTRASGGSQSLEFSTNPGYGSDAYLDLTEARHSGQWILSFDIYQPSEYDGTAHIYISRGATGSGVFQEGFHFQGNGTTGRFYDSGSTQLSLIQDRWVNVRVDIDLDANTAEARYGGDLFYIGPWNNGGNFPNQIQGVNIWAAEGTTAAAFNIDNFMLVDPASWAALVPEPSGLTLLGLGVLGLGLRRRRS
ncbi:MAG: PEP-CTERM sorting domain-containing protein [Verrucomicrobiota bacterium]|nr:PEP-CTERM sorting domain-containing protein [Verrucomicrobiota bacterium]